MLRFASVIYFVLAFSVSVLARDPHFFLFNTNNGLPSSEVYRTVQDEDGKYWFATDRGACLYDGYGFKVYTTKDGLANNTSLRIHRDPWGNLWFMGVDGSLSVWDGKKIRPFPLNEELMSLPPQTGVVAQLGWELPGKLVVLVRNYKWPKLVIFDLKAMESRFISQSGYETDWLMFEDEHQKFWNVGGVIVPENTLPSASLLVGNDFFYLPVFHSGVIRKATVGAKEELQSYDLGTYVNKFDVDSKGNLWVSTRDGLALFREKDLSKEPQWFFRGLSLSSVLEDKEGNYWLTTLDKGILMVPSFQIEAVDLEGNSEEKGRVIALLPLENHLVYGTLSGKVMSIDTTGKVAEEAFSPNNFGQFAYSSGRGKEGVLGKYKVREEKEGLILERLEGYTESAKVLELSTGQLAFGMNPGVRLLPRDEYFFEKSKGFRIRVMCLLELGNQVWMGTHKGLWAFELEGFSGFARMFPGEPSLGSRINSLQSDGFGGAFVGTIGEGLVHVRENTVSVVDQAKGLSSNMINQVFLEEPGLLWCATNLGLDQVRYKVDGGFEVLEIKRYNTSDGLAENQIQDVACWQGRVWVASSEGLFHFSQAEMDANRSSEPRSVLWDGITVNNQVVSPEGIHQLSYEQNDLAFRFLTVSMRKPTQGAFYRYRLVGGSSEWEYSRDRTVRFPDLPPGSYTFEAEARNRQGEWSAEPASFSFVIAPHFSQTNWFRALVLLLIVGLVAGALLYRSRRYRRKVEDRRKLQEARLRAQEAEITILRNQMNPHFVFNALNSIQNFIFKQEPARASYYLSRFSNLMRDGLRFSGTETVPLSEELGFIRTYMELESMRFPDRFTFELKVDGEIDPEEIRVPPFLFQPLLENAVKHAFKDIDYAGELLLALSLAEEDILTAVVRDNGPGFDPDDLELGRKPHRSMGLKIVRDRVALLNAGEGAGPALRTAKFELVNLAASGGKGTEANFTIPI